MHEGKMMRSGGVWDRWGWTIAVIAGLVAFAGVLRHGFVYWDDHREIFENPYFRPPTWRGLGHFWVEQYYGLYAPLAYSVQWVIAHVARGEDGKFNAAWFHAANLAAHLWASVAVWGVIRKVVGGSLGPILGAVVFAVHPLQAEAVNWASSFYTPFSAALGISAIWVYLEHRNRVRAGNKGWGSAALATGMYGLAICAKPSLVVVPLLAGIIEILMRGTRVREVAVLLGAWVLIALPMIWVTVHVQEGQYRGTVALWERPLVMADAVGWYMRKVAWPWPMGADYGRSPERIRETGELWWTWIVPIAVLVASWAGRKRAPWGPGALGVFVVGALPFLGLLTFGFQRYSTVADRYIYVGMLGVALAVGEIVKNWSKWMNVAGAVCLLWIAGSIMQSQYWRDTRSLMGHALVVNPTSRVGHDVLAYLAMQEGNDAEAVRQYQATLTVFPDDGFANFNLGNRALSRGDLTGAEALYRRALKDRPDDAQVHANLGVALARGGNSVEAEKEFRRAVMLSPEWGTGWVDLGALLMSEGRNAEARTAYQKALEAEPEMEMAKRGLQKLNSMQQ